MANLYNKDAIRTELSNRLEKSRAYLAAWEAVTFRTKKNGEPFAVLSKNIDGAKIYREEYALQNGENKIRVCTFTPCAGYISDEITAYKLESDIKNDPAKLAKPQNLAPQSCSWLQRVYIFDLEDIKLAIAERVAYLREYVADLEKQLTALDSVFDAYRAAYAAAAEILESATAEFSHRDLYYSVRDCVKERYPYC